MIDCNNSFCSIMISRILAISENLVWLISEIELFVMIVQHFTLKL